VVSAIGMVSPIGASATQTLTSIRAGIRRMREAPEIYRCLPSDPMFEEREPLVASALYHLDDTARRDVNAAQWLAQIARAALDDLILAGRLVSTDLRRMGLFLAIPPERPGFGPELVGAVAAALRAHLAPDAPAELRILRAGHAGALALLDEAVRALRDQRVEVAAVGGVDSHLFTPWLAALDSDWKLLSQRNPDGFKPGEAGAFVLLEPARQAERRGLSAHATLVTTASARVDIARGTPIAGAELASVLERVLPQGEAPVVVCDLNGVAARTREWGFAVSRLGRRLQTGFGLEHPASVLGDVCAATGAVLLAVAANRPRWQWPERHAAVVWAASDDGDRRAVRLQRV
jgi:3-oxoacyl-[acyl-carrier-protein] synthase-1